MVKQFACQIKTEFLQELYLTLYHTILTFYHPEEQGFGKHSLEREKMLVTSILSFSHSVFYSIKERNHQLTHSHTMTPFDALGKQAS